MSPNRYPLARVCCPYCGAAVHRFIEPVVMHDDNRMKVTARANPFTGVVDLRVTLKIKGSESVLIATSGHNCVGILPVGQTVTTPDGVKHG